MEPVKEPTQEQRNNPSLRAEIAFYDALTGVSLDGSVYYDVRVGKQVDAFAWFEDQWRGAIEVKGGQHMVRDGFWYCRETDGKYTKLETSPPDQAVAAAMAVRDTIKRRLHGHQPWINAVLVLPDMATKDSDISQYAKDHRVGVIWGLANLQTQLLGIIAAQHDWNPPDELDIQAESSALNRSTPPQQWLARKAAQDDAAAPSQSQGLPVQFNGPAPNRGVHAGGSPIYSFEIHNHGTLNLYLCDCQLSALKSDAFGPESASVQSPDAIVPNPPVAAPHDGIAFDAPPDLEPDPFEGPLVGDVPDDYDPFS